MGAVESYISSSNFSTFTEGENVELFNSQVYFGLDIQTTLLFSFLQLQSNPVTKINVNLIKATTSSGAVNGRRSLSM